MPYYAIFKYLASWVERGNTDLFDPLPPTTFEQAQSPAKRQSDLALLIESRLLGLGAL